MAEILGVAAVFGFFAAVVVSLYVMGTRIRTRGRSSVTVSLTGVFSPFEEIWHPAAYRARQIAETMQHQRDSAPAPGDPSEPDVPSHPSPTRYDAGDRDR
jgi:hypothetical protein